MKKSISIFLIALLTIILVSCGKEKEESAKYDTYKFEEKDSNFATDGLLIMDGVVNNYLGSDTVVYIPSTYEGMEVTTIASGAFSSTNVEAIYLPGSITTIEAQAFENAEQLNSIHQSENVNYIGDKAFNNTPWYDNQQGLIKFGKAAVMYKGQMKEEYTIPEDITFIANGAFSEQQTLTTINLSNVEVIDDCAFKNSVNLRNITAGSAFFSAGQGAFTGTAWYSAQKLGVLYLGNVACGYKGTMMKDEKIEIKEGTTSISIGAFYGQDLLSEVTMASTIKRIGKQAFYGCSQIRNINLPEGLELIESEAFKNCEQIAELVVPGSVKVIGEASFSNIGATAVTLNEGLVEIADNAFQDSILIKKIEFPASLVKIGSHAFDNCKKIKTVKFVNNSKLTDLGEEAFVSCTNMTSFDLGTNASLTYISKNCFKGCTKLATLKLSGAPIVEYQSGAFYGCTALVSFEMGSNITEIAESTFTDCTSLASIDFKNSKVETIGNMAFSGCTALTSITLPDSVKKIDKYAFLQAGLESFNVGKNIIVIEPYAFSYAPIKAFSVDSENNLYKQIEGVLYSKDGASLVAYPCGKEQDSFSVEGAEVIVDGAFMGANRLMEITISDSVKEIGDYAFTDCKILESIIVLGSTPAKLGSKVFNTTDCVINVPADAKDAYLSAWKSYKSKIN